MNTNEKETAVELSAEQAKLLNEVGDSNDFVVAALTDEVEEHTIEGASRLSRINVAYGITDNDNPEVAWVDVSRYTKNGDTTLIPCKFSGINGIKYKESAEIEIFGFLEIITKFIGFATKVLSFVVKSFLEFAEELKKATDYDDKVTQANLTEDVIEDKKDKLNDKDSSIDVKLPKNVLPKEAALDLNQDSFESSTAGITIYRHNSGTKKTKQLIDDASGSIASIMMKPTPYNVGWRIPQGTTHIGFRWNRRSGGKNIGDCWGVLYLYGRK